MTSRWWRYQAERFPLAAHGPLIAAFTLAALGVSRLSGGREGIPELTEIGAAFFSILCFFLLLRVADEFKDFEDDCCFRPYRPVPRGLVTLRELAGLGLAGLAIQGGLALWVHPRLLPLLIGLWLYLACMTREFFVPAWLRAHPLIYLVSHMLIVPLIGLYGSAFDWLAAGHWPSTPVVWFLLLCFFNGCVVELGRKIRAPHEEETGVETYSALWGMRRAVLGWSLALCLAGAACLLAALRPGPPLPMVALLVALSVPALMAAGRALARPHEMRAACFQLTSGIWVLGTYLVLWGIPLLARG
jgi:4-hydroxybenzoate polyprenyltransferase